MKTNKNPIAKRSAGRPAAKINYPNRKFTFPELMKENTHVTPLCLRQTLKRDAELGKKSLIVKIKGELRKNASGKGRKLEVYQKRSRITDASTVASVKPVKTITVAVPAPVAAPVAIVDAAEPSVQVSPEPAADGLAVA